MIRSVFQLFFRALPLWVIISIVIQVVLSNQLVILGKKVHVIDLEKERIFSENEQVAQQAAMLTSLAKLEERAIALGFIRPQHILTIRANSFIVALQLSK